MAINPQAITRVSLRMCIILTLKQQNKNFDPHWRVPSDHLITIHSWGYDNTDLSKDKSMRLLRYDFNEPRCGKDQCDRESATAKTIISSFVDAKNVSAEALHYGKGMKDAAIVIRVTDTDLEGQKIKNIKNYHSVEFKKKEMVFRRYYKIGKIGSQDMVINHSFFLLVGDMKRGYCPT